MEAHINNIKDLGQNITQKLQNGSKLRDLKFLIQQYDGSDLLKFVQFSNSGYTRNVVFQNDLIDVVVISWNEHQCCKIHDHPDNGCLMKIMDGKLIENVYTRSIQNNEINNGSFDDLKLCNTNILLKNDISFIQGKNGLHRITNEQNAKTISLHIYSPPKYTPSYYNV